MTKNSEQDKNPEQSRNPEQDGAQADAAESLHEHRLWRDKGWTARVVKNIDDDGWAVEMVKDGEPEPALVGPWTMGRDKRNPKPLDVNAFNTLVKTASEVLRRHEQHLHALHHKRLELTVAGERIAVTLEIVPDEYEPYAVLTACDAFGETIASVRVRPTFKLTTSSASDWIDGGYRKPG